MSIPINIQSTFRVQGGWTYLCQRARPAVVSSLAFQASFVSEGSPFSKTVLFRSSKNCCAYSSSFFCSTAACARFETLPEPRGGVCWVSGIADCLGVAVRFFGAVSRDGVFATGGVILIGFFPDFGGSLGQRSDQDRLSFSR